MATERKRDETWGFGWLPTPFRGVPKYQSDLWELASWWWWAYLEGLSEREQREALEETL